MKKDVKKSIPVNRCFGRNTKCIFYQRLLRRYSFSLLEKREFLFVVGAISLDCKRSNVCSFY
jgi:hypothetical protein